MELHPPCKATEGQAAETGLEETPAGEWQLPRGVIAQAPGFRKPRRQVWSRQGQRPSRPVLFVTSPSGAQAILVIAIPVVRVAFVRGFQRMADAMDKMNAGGGDDEVIP